MNRISLLTACGLAVTACDAGETSLVVLGIAIASSDPSAPTVCAVKASETEFGPPMVLDTAVSYKMSLPFSVTNNLDADTLTNMATPVRMEARWECDSNGFTSELGALVVPAFDPRRPFCLDRRADTTEDFVGFDFVPLRGGAIAPATAGLSTAKVVPFQLGAAFDEALQIAVLADKCCRKPMSGCDGQDNTANSECVQLTDIFTALDPDGRFGLSVASNQAGTPSSDLLFYRPFAVFDGSYDASITTHDHGVLALGARYPMRFRGILEYLLQDGRSITTNEHMVEISVCRNCGPAAGPTTRNPHTIDPCYYR